MSTLRNVFDMLPLEHPVALAPLAGITDAPFRRICLEQGCRFLYAEMTSSEALVRNSHRAQVRIAGMDSNAPTIAQLLGNKPAVMADAAAICADMGADGIDINLGCPAKQIVKGGGGSALMKEPDLIAEIIQSIVRRVSVPVSVKMRAGWDDKCRNAVEIAQIAVSEGARAIAVHPRTRTQAFKGSANWEVIARVKESVDIPVLGNGDVRTRADMLRMREETGCDAVMVGRAALGAPWVFRLMEDPDFSAPSYEQRIDIAIQHLLYMAEEKGDQRASIEFRKHLACYLKSMPDVRMVREKMNRMDSVATIIDILCDYREKSLGPRASMPQSAEEFSADSGAMGLSD